MPLPCSSKTGFKVISLTCASKACFRSTHHRIRCQHMRGKEGSDIRQRHRAETGGNLPTLLHYHEKMHFSAYNRHKSNIHTNSRPIRCLTVALPPYTEMPVSPSSLGKRSRNVPLRRAYNVIYSGGMITRGENVIQRGSPGAAKRISCSFSCPGRLEGQLKGILRSWHTGAG